MGHLETQYFKQSKKIEADILKKPKVKKNKNEKRKSKKKHLASFKAHLDKIVII